MVNLVNRIYLFHTLQEFKDHKKGDIVNLLKNSIIIAFLYMIIDYSIHFLFDGLAEKYYLRTDRYTDYESRTRRSYTIVRWSYNIIYYTFTSIYAYMLIKDTSFMPPFLGGNGSPHTIAQNRYLQETTQGMHVFYYMQLGKHLGRYFSHVFIRPQGTYYEYLLHHTLSTFLILFSYSMDMWVMGIFVLFVHDASDIFLALCRMYRQYRSRNKHLLNLFYVFAVGSWIGLRVLSFSYCCVYVVWYQCITKASTLSKIQYEVFMLPYFFMAFMCSCLLVMHVFWTYFIIESFISSSFSDKVAKHSYD